MKKENMEKNKIKEKLKGDNKIEGRNSMGVSESFYDKFFLTNYFLKSKKLNPEDLSERELNLLLDLADYAGDCFY